MKPKTISLGGRELIETTVSGATHGKIPDDPRTVLLPYRPPDDHRAFPADPELENAFAFVGSGLAAHEVRRNKGDSHPGFVAADLIIFKEDEWYFECFQVLLAHGWVSPVGGLSADLVSKVVSVIGAFQVEEAKREYGESWGCYIGEVAAVHFAEPLSRLWYAANLMSLFFVHQDDLRFGYLWAEYQLRIRSEVDTVRGKKLVRDARAGGKARAEKSTLHSQKILAAMAAHIGKGKSISNAASLAAKAGLGASMDANRKLWTRNRGK